LRFAYRQLAISTSPLFLTHSSMRSAGPFLSMWTPMKASSFM
jgi:hypothetical protein